MPINKVAGVKKDGLQKYRIRVNYIDAQGKYCQKERHAYGIDAAKAVERQLQMLADEKELAASMTVQQLYDEYMQAKKFEIRESTWDKSRRTLERYVLPEVKHLRIEKLNARSLQAWKSSVESQGLAIKTRKNIFSDFRAMLNYAVKMGYLPKNPLVVVGNFKDAYTPKKEMDYYTAEEFRRFINEAFKAAECSDDLEDWHYCVFFCIAFYTGMRKGEIHALRWSDLQEDRIFISRSLCQKLKGEDRETPPKNSSSIRDVQIPKPLLQVLEAHRARCQNIEGFTHDMKICGCTRALRDTSLQKRNKAYAERAGLKVIRIHDFRHSHASLLANSGINIQEISRRLGHSNIEETWNTYAHLYPKEEERAVGILNTVKI